MYVHVPLHQAHTLRYSAAQLIILWLNFASKPDITRLHYRSLTMIKLFSAALVRAAISHMVQHIAHLHDGLQPCTLCTDNAQALGAISAA